MLLKKMRSHAFSNFFICLQLAALFAYCLVEMATIQSTFWIDTEIKARLGDSYGRIVQLDVDSETDYGDFEKMRGELIESGACEEICCYHTGGSIYAKDGAEYNLTEVSDGMQQLLQPELSEGRFFEKKDFASGETAVVAGAEIAEKYGLAVGDDLADRGFEEGGRVIGVLKEGQRWFFGNLDSAQCVLLDNQIVRYSPEEHVRLVYYGIVDREEDVQNAVKSVSEAAKKYGITLSATPLRQILQQNLDQTVRGNISWIALALLIVVMIAVGTAILIYARIQEQGREIGIYMAFGYGKGKIIQSQAAEIGLVSAAAFAVAYGAARLFIGNGQTELFNAVCITGESVELWMAGIVLGIMLIMLAPSIFMITLGILRMQPAELIGGKE